MDKEWQFERALRLIASGVNTAPGLAEHMKKPKRNIDSLLWSLRDRALIVRSDWTKGKRGSRMAMWAVAKKAQLPVELLHSSNSFDFSPMLLDTYVRHWPASPRWFIGQRVT